MNHEHDRLEAELMALRPLEPSEKLAERIGARLKLEAVTPASKVAGTWGLRKTLFVAPLGVLAAAVLACLIWWSVQDNTQEAAMPLDLPQPTLASALDNSLPSVWTYRPALDSPGTLETLLDKHAPRPGAGGENVQTRGFGPVTIDLNSRLGGL